MRRGDLPFVPPDASIREAVAVIDLHGVGIALAVDGERRLVGTITDGDIRRAMLAGVDFAVSVAALLEGRASPVTAPVGTASAELVALMQQSKLRQIPLVEEAGRVADLALLENLIDASDLRLRAVVMAGGYGRRLAPLTDDTPKPMLPVGDRPLLQRIVEQLRDAGISHVNLTTHYRGDAISEHFGDGSDFGVQIEYVPEERPLGTAGALGLVHSDDPILVMNGDILTRIDFRAMHHFHNEHGADMTIAVRPYELTVPYGVVELTEAHVAGISEKPLVRGFVNAGIYLVAPSVREFVSPGDELDMPELIARLIRGRRTVVGFPLREYWLDIGRLSDYEQALADVAEQSAPIR